MVIRTLARAGLILTVALVWSSQAAALTFFLDKSGGDCTVLTASSCKADGTTITLDVSFRMDAGDTTGTGGMNGIFTSASWTNADNIFMTSGSEPPSITIQSVTYLPLIAGVALNNTTNVALQWDFFNIIGDPSAPNPFAQAPSVKTFLGSITFDIAGNGNSDGGGAEITYGTPNVILDGLTRDGSTVLILGTAATYTIVPEPTTAGLLSLGLLGIVAGRRKTQ